MKHDRLLEMNTNTKFEDINLGSERIMPRTKTLEIDIELFVS